MPPPKALQKQLQEQKKGGDAAEQPHGGGALRGLGSVLCAPFGVLRCPNMKLRISLGTSDSSGLSFSPFLLLFALYFLIISGAVYVVINQPPSMGTDRDPKTGGLRHVAFMGGRINGQYIMEGLSAGLAMALGGAGFVMLDRANDKHVTIVNNRMMLTISGMISILSSLGLCQLFVRIKIPNYLL
uniref:Oligosaccharyltransferase complex subunit n=1 Tax=Hemiselmis andersenii TaxID=464988 RepID=A0A6U4KFW6_HEMAN